MLIQIQGVGRDKLLGARVARLVQEALVTLRVRPVSASVRFSDDNGPRGGPAMRCAINVRAPYQPELRVEHSATKARTAFDLALASLGRQLERCRERHRDNSRHPKKYFVAKRAEQ